MKVILRWTYKHAKLPSTIFTSDEIESKEVMSLIGDLEKTGRVQNLVVIDESGNEWTKKQYKKLMDEILEEPHDVVVYFDGNHQPNSSKAGGGIVIYYRQNDKTYRIRYNDQFDFLEDNNEAEYCALHAGMMLLEELGIHHQRVKLRGDSLVVLNQLSGDWPCYEDKLNKWLDRIEKYVEKLGIEIITEPIQRKDNVEAHKLAKQAMEGSHISSTSEISEDGI